MVIVREKEYRFDEKLISNNIRFIDRETFNRFITNIPCNRCNATLTRNVVNIRIDETYYQIGEDCYISIKNRLSEIRGKSLYWIRIDLEEDYDKHLQSKFSRERLNSIINKETATEWHPDYSKFKELEWDIIHGNPPNFKKKEYEKLKKKFEQI